LINLAQEFSQVSARAFHLCLSVHYYASLQYFTSSVVAVSNVYYSFICSGSCGSGEVVDFELHVNGPPKLELTSTCHFGKPTHPGSDFMFIKSPSTLPQNLGKHVLGPKA